MTIKEDFNKTFGPPPSELPANMANAMGIDQAIWGARIQGAKWMAQQFALKAEYDGNPDAAKEIRQLAKELE